MALLLSVGDEMPPPPPPPLPLPLLLILLFRKSWRVSWVTSRKSIRADASAIPADCNSFRWLSVPDASAFRRIRFNPVLFFVCLFEKWLQRVSYPHSASWTLSGGFWRLWVVEVDIASAFRSIDCICFLFKWLKLVSYPHSGPLISSGGFWHC